MVKIAFQLRDYQIELVEGVKESILNNNKKILVQSAAGSGKTVTMAKIAKGATDKGNKVLFVVHRREIVSQAKATFYNNGVNPELSYIGMVQTVTNRLDRLKEPDIIFVDEAHHSLAKTYKRIFEYFNNSYVLGFTATPVRTNGAGLGEVYEDLIIGKSVQWLVDNKRLAPFEYYSVDLTNHDKLKLSSTRDFTYQSITDALGKTIFGDVIDTYEKVAKGEKTIVYTHTVEASKDVADAFNAAGHKAKQVDGTTNKEERKQAMQDFRDGKINILTNAELYGEGVDIPDCTTVILLRPTMSLSLHIQQSMRPMRYQPNKTAKIIDHVGNVYRHGLPTTEHEWTLEAREKKKNNSGNKNTIPLKECTNCFGVVESKEKICPLCGHEFEVEVNELETVDTKLKRIDELSFKTDYEKIKWASKKVSELETIEDYVKYAEAKGYKKSWIKFQHPQLKAMNWPQFYQIIN